MPPRDSGNATVHGRNRQYQRRCAPTKAALASEPLGPGQLRLGWDLVPQFVAALRGQPEQVPKVEKPVSRRSDRDVPAETSGRSYLEFPARSQDPGAKGKEPELVRVRLTVPYRVHSRQMLCIGGSQIPFGWSFLSIAKVPMTWTEGDIWQAEVIAICVLLSISASGHAPPLALI